ncbi:PREDICTED: DDT domain-containing protein DDR4 [Tarenaya hassleriana]|uniref:DDT domain-containing protein DDR4 n=1 Tax=Tarenaya hassleriana TaxID=28532 RepID=UPI00053C5AFE|nr:PREDICTED: DDT domain-containing protein DDR4 [Tarenaya hassleriana]
MVCGRRITASQAGHVCATMEEELGGGSTMSGDSSPESEVKQLRGRWELASALNFLNVFEPVIADELKLTAEEIETGLIESNNTNARLHIALLKGIPPVSKSLEDSDAWITVLCKKLTPWWPWIAEGDMPITAMKGEEISEYQGLDPTNRLYILKALCELRAEQDDVLSYINDNVKQGTQVSFFRKEKLGGDGKKISYWFDGNDIQGYRLYREVTETNRKTNRRRNKCLALSPGSFHWETLATNLEEFYIVSKELSSSKSSALTATGQMIENDVIPLVENLQKKKERVLKKKMKQEMLAKVSANICYPTRTTRPCRNRTPATYTFDEYDRMISQAVEETDESDGDNEQRRKRKPEQEEDEAPETDSGEDSKEGCYNGRNNDESSDRDQNRKTSAKNRLRQRPTRNSALLQSVVVLDSEEDET